MVSTSEDVGETLNVALACGAAFQAVAAHNARGGHAIRSVALPGLGAGTGRVPVEVCADLMWTAFNLFREGAFDSFESMRAALEGELGDLGPAWNQNGPWPYRSPAMARWGAHA
jgi:O-acetyl-ADP-ribose deacetylase (regulator of RNase III)